MKKLISILLLASFISISAIAQSAGIRTQAETAIMVDLSSDSLLFEKDADMQFSPASLTKLMTIYIAFNELKIGNLRMDDEVVVSANAWRNWRGKGSTMFLNHKDKVTIEQLLKGIVILSGNDACVVLAEHISSSHEIFVQEMNAMAIKLGMKNTNFTNSNGWPNENQYTSARDMSLLAARIIRDFPEYYPLFSERKFLYKNFTSNTRSRNPLYSRYPFPGADGMKTGGDPEVSEFGIVASAVRDNRRLLLVMGKLPSVAVRGSESQRMMQIGFRQFKSYPLFKKGEKVDSAEVWLGKELVVPLVVDQDITLTLSRSQRAQMKVTVEFTQPVAAPIANGQAIGKLTVSVPNAQDRVYDLKAGSAIEGVGGFGKIGAALSYLVFGSAGAEK
ncbi:D-alanyl-D-alanine carboxypeptidase family protein [Temperatibacter marinus]|uniref:serine-type D-Ala-D-Ala carboxypeptidase n=1 Tax=Temperatibacter marinus TaxID=1456591 RepID=A0AA52HA61_9PROT|nr:D-alanyl-D-alanine carboxypeptidase family protein [Temperatibacter marinus]WND02258.1 D-alanyl-D-alanine carboxypeptidase family protein [Temperatibacter marinus]